MAAAGLNPGPEARDRRSRAGGRILHSPNKGFPAGKPLLFPRRIRRVQPADQREDKPHDSTTFLFSINPASGLPRKVCLDWQRRSFQDFPNTLVQYRNPKNKSAADAGVIALIQRLNQDLEANNTRRIPPENVTVGDWAKKFTDIETSPRTGRNASRNRSCSLGTLDTYKTYYNTHIRNDPIAGMLMSEVDEDDVTTFTNRLSVKKLKNGAPMAGSRTFTGIVIFLRMVFREYRRKHKRWNGENHQGYRGKNHRGTATGAGYKNSRIQNIIAGEKTGRIVAIQPVPATMDGQQCRWLSGVLRLYPVLPSRIPGCGVKSLPLYLRPASKPGLFLRFLRFRRKRRNPGGYFRSLRFGQGIGENGACRHRFAKALNLCFFPPAGRFPPVLNAAKIRDGLQFFCYAYSLVMRNFFCPAFIVAGAIRGA
jgi:hypothetical protein